MVKRAKLVNTGEIDANVNPQGNEPEVSGYAPGVLETVMEDANAEPEAQDSEQDIADQEAAGVIPDKPSRPNGSNQPEPPTSQRAQYSRLKRDVYKLGSAYGSSKTSMIALAEVVTEAAQSGAVLVEQVEEIYEQFKAGSSKSATYEDAGEVPDEAGGVVDPAKSIAQQLSKLRQFIYLGIKYNNDGDALNLVRRARNMHIELLRDANGNKEVKKGIKPGSTYSVLVDVARAQLKKNKDAVEAAKKNNVKHIGVADVLTDKELRDLMTQEVKEDTAATGEKYLLDTLVKAEATKKGGRERNAITCEELDNAIEWLRAALGKIDPAALTKHDKETQDAIDARAKAEAEKVEREAEKARKAAEPKETKAQRQAKLAEAQPQPAA